MEGQGEMIWPTGDKYIGDWEGDTRHGFGLYLYQSGNRQQYVAGKKVRVNYCPVRVTPVTGSVGRLSVLFRPCQLGTLLV